MGTIKAILSATGVIVNTLIIAIALFVLAPLKALPIRPLRNWVRVTSARLAEVWIGNNNLMLGIHRHPVWQVRLPDDLDREASYLVNSNHQSWVDIVVLQRILNRRAPFMRFFIKQQLIWVPVIGLAWWVLDFPFMGRYSKDQIKRRPELRGRDLETTRKACEKFREIPTSIMNFLEGTRFTRVKHERQQSPYENLLRPRIGGIAQVLHSLGDRLDALIDVTIVYPGGVPTLWQLISGQVPEIVVDVRTVPIPQDLIGRSLREDREFAARLGGWTSQLWRDKDDRINELRTANTIPPQ